MKTKIALLLTGCLLTVSLIGCGGTQEEVSVPEDTTMEVSSEETPLENPTEEKNGIQVEYTEEQLAFIEEYNHMVEYYNVLAVDSINASELVNDQELVDTMNSLTQSIEEMGEVCNNPELLTAEVMENYRIAFEEIYDFAGNTWNLFMETTSKEFESSGTTTKNYQSFTMMYDGDAYVTQIKCKWESDSEWIELLGEEPLKAGNGIYTNLEVKEETLLIKFVFDNGKEVDDSLSWETIQELNSYYEGDCVVNFSTGGIWDA